MLRTKRTQKNNNFSQPYALPSEISISHENFYSISDIDHPRPEIVRTLKVNHCNLSSLEGIQAFGNLQILNLKYNNLQHADGLYLIKNKQKIVELNIEGNDIQYFAVCTFAALRQNGFTGLKMLNNKDYSRWGKKKEKVPSMRSVYSSMKKVEKDMGKTLKRTIKNNIMEKYRADNDQNQEQYYQTTSRVSQKSNTHTKENHTGYNSTKQKHYQTESEGYVMRDISLSNANMVKSVKAYQNEDYQLEKNNNGRSYAHGLVIEPVQFDENHASHMPLTQPTATFASQRQKQNMPFRSRNSRRSIINMVDQCPDEDENCEQDISFQSQIPQHTYRFSIPKSHHGGQNIDASYFYDIHENMNMAKETIAQVFYVKNLLKRAFQKLKPSNIPCQMGLF